MDYSLPFTEIELRARAGRASVVVIFIRIIQHRVPWWGGEWMKLRIRPRVGYSKHTLVEVEVDPADKCNTLKQVCYPPTSTRHPSATQYYNIHYFSIQAATHYTTSTLQALIN